VTITGDSAKLIYKSLNNIKPTTTKEPTNTWYQKVAQSVTCDKVVDDEDKKTSYSCTMTFLNGETLNGSAG
jgi:hypothetical protein